MMKRINMQLSQIVLRLLAAVILSSALVQVGCFSFNFPIFKPEDVGDLILSRNSQIFQDAIQVTPDLSHDMTNMSGRVSYRKPYRLWSKKKNQTAAFNTTFVLNILPRTSPVGGEGLAFILAADTSLPENSEGRWLGIVNSTTNGTSRAAILAVEFDTRNSSIDDGPDDHVGISINSVYSIKQAQLMSFGINISSGSNVTVTIQYANDMISVFGAMSETAQQGMETLLISPPLNLSSHLPEKVYVGFAGSTSIYTELNCVRAWKFTGTDIGDDGNRLWVWITVPAALIIIGAVLFILFWHINRRREISEDAYPRIEDQIQGSSMAPKKFRLRKLKKATRNFSPQNKLGEGGFGTVYKGILGDKEIAVKRVSKDSRQGKQEFIAEVTTIGNLNHKNLVKLIGWCYENRELLLIYEFMPNGSLDRYLFSDEKFKFCRGERSGSDSELCWETRHSVIYGVAEALNYLHCGSDKKVLHRDIKASNIMLDLDFNAKLGDFGLARTIQKRNETHHSTKEIAGTPGYMAPETLLSGGRATVETDVYAFGVLVEEVICGKRPGNPYGENDHNQSLVYWVWDLYGKGRILDSVDDRIAKEIKEKEQVVERVLVLGLACCHPNPHQRPSMNTVLKVLTGEASPPVVPKERPAFVWPVMPLSFKEDADSSILAGQITPFTELTGR